MTQEQEMFPYIANLLNSAEVVWKPLGEVAELKRGTTITKKTSNEGAYPVISGGQQPAYYINQFNRDGETITVAGSGAYAGFVMYWNEPIFVGDAFSVKANEEQVSPRYIYHFLLSIQDKIYDLKSGGGVPHVYAKDVARFPIPLPPLSVQQEIVRILDKFTTLEAELEAELEARKKQYEYYRNKLLTFGDEVEWKPLGEVGTFVRGNGLQKKDFVESGIGCIHYGQIYTYYGIKASKTISYVPEEFAKTLRKASHNDLVIAAVSENIEDVCKCVVWEGKEDICVSGDTFVFKTEQNPHYIGHLLRTNNFLNYKRKNAVGAKVTRLQAGSLPKYIIPLPPLAEQARIVSILDKFDTLVNSICEGLPKEIELRRKQYEYYRDQLLSFSKHEVTA